MNAGSFRRGGRPAGIARGSIFDRGDGRPCLHAPRTGERGTPGTPSPIHWRRGFGTRYDFLKTESTTPGCINLPCSIFCDHTGGPFTRRYTPEMLQPTCFKPPGSHHRQEDDKLAHFTPIRYRKRPRLSPPSKPERTNRGRGAQRQRMTQRRSERRV